MNRGVRFSATTAESGHLIHRPRVTLALSQRFDRRVTLVTGAAGYGKSAALSLAVENNRLDPIGRDVWLSAVPNDVDPDHFVAGLTRAFGLDPAGGIEHSLDRLCDALWVESPTDVALIIDDAHLLTSTESRNIVVELIGAMPTNAHIVLASRQALDIPVSRLRSHGQLLEIGPRDLEFDPTELGELIALRSADRPTGRDAPRTDDADLPRHAASADLTLAAGRRASVEFLWEEILADLDPDRLADLQRTSVVEALDDHLVHDLTDGRFGLDDLLVGIPLTVHIGASVRLHSLLRDALRERLPAAEERKALAIAGGVERERRRWSEAVQLFDESGDRASTLDTIRSYCLAPAVHRTIEDSIVLMAVVNRLRPGGGLAGAVEISHVWLGLSGQDFSRQQVDQLAARTIEQLRADGDTDLETIQRHLRLQDSHFSAQPGNDADRRRLAELAEEPGLARAFHAFNESQRLADLGDVEGALAMVDVLRESSDSMAVLVPERFADLGRHERVVTTTPDEIREEAPMTGYAMWLRGEAAPELAFAVVNAQMPSVLRRGFDIVSLSTLGVGVAIAAAAGEIESAARWTEHANTLVDTGIHVTAELFAHMATAIEAAQRGDEAAATAALAPERTGVSWERWPPRASLLNVPLAYLVRPDARPMFDRHEYGPATTTALQAGRALVALREHGEAELATQLPWMSADLLRANVLPVHLIELGVAAHAAGSRTAADVVRAVPRLGELVAIVGDRLPEAFAQSINEFSSHGRVHTLHTLHTSLLGDIDVMRDGASITDERWVRRAKVRELWAYLVSRRSATRDEIIRDLWPDSQADRDAEEKTLANLRSTLSMLIKIVEPDRAERGATFIHADAKAIELSGSVVSDLDELQDESRAAQAADASQLPLESLRRHRRVIELYRGPFAASIDAGWLVLERIRLQTIALSSMCRVAELTLARGEPESAIDIAREARRHDPLHERAGRVFVAALAAAGDRAAALTSAEELERRWAAEGWMLEPATARAFERLRSGSA